MNETSAGYAVDPDELVALAREAAELSETIRRTWRRDWFEAGTWPDSDPLRTAVITYRRSLRAAMERLCGGAEQLSARLRQIAVAYRATDAHVAAQIERVANGE